MKTTALELEAEIHGEERAIRHLIGERAALTSKIKRDEAHRKLLQAQLHRITTRAHAAVARAFPHGARFPDVSAYQPNVDVGAVRHAGSVRVGELLVTKITEGASWTDAYGPHRWREMEGAGFPHRGGYAFLHPSVDGAAQAEHMLAALDAAGVVVRASDVLIADAEVTDGRPAAEVRACVRAFAAVIAKHTPAKRWLYTGGPFARENGLSLAGYDAHWLPAYVGDPRPFYVFGTPIAWQYTDGRYGPAPHVCPGIGPCDMSIVL